MQTSAFPVYYTYLWLREDGTPYYAGKGQKRRAYVKDGHSCAPPKEKSRILIQNFPDERSAFEAEIFLICFYGRKNLGTGCLLNLTDGGEGLSNPSALTIGKMRAAKVGERHPNWGKKRSAETRTKIGLANTGKPSPRRGVVLSTETRRKMGLAKMGNTHGSGSKGIRRSAETCERISESLKGNKNAFGHRLSAESLARCLRGIEKANAALSAKRIAAKTNVGK